MHISEWNLETALEVRGEEAAMGVALEIAERMKNDGYDVDFIAKITDLTPDEILTYCNRTPDRPYHYPTRPLLRQKT